MTKHKAYAYLRSRVIDAHRSGEAGTVRHLSAVALNSLLTNKDPGICLNEVHWAFIYSIYWMKHPRELEAFLTPAYEAFAERPGALGAILDFLFQLLQPDWSNLKERAKELGSIHISELDGSGEQPENALLVGLILEILWRIDRPVRTWETLSSSWLQGLNDSSPVRQSLSTTGARLRDLDHVLFGAGQEVASDHESSAASSVLANGWQAFYRLDTRALDAIIPELVEVAPFSSEYFLSAQGLVNITKKVRMDFALDAGGPRYQRALMSRPASLIQSLRLAVFDEEFGAARRKPQGAGRLRVQLLRIAMLTEIAALRTWDLGAYLGVQSRTSQLLIDIGTFRWLHYRQAGRNGDELVEGVMTGIRGLGYDEETQDEMDLAVHLIEVMDDAPQLLERLVTTLLTVRPLERLYAVKILKLLEDAFPVQRLTELATWTVALEQATYQADFWFDRAHLVFWAPILQHCEVSAEVWATITALAGRIAGRPSDWSSNESLLASILQYGPPDCARAISETMLTTPTTDHHEERVRRALLFNAAHENPVLKESVVHYLDTQLVKEPDDVALRTNRDHLRSAGQSSDSEDAKGREQLISQFVGWCQQLQPAEPNTWSLTANDTCHEFRRMSWDGAPEEQIDAILSSAETALALRQLPQEDAADIVVAVIGIAYSRCENIRRRIAAWATRLVESPPHLHRRSHVISTEPGPFDSFSMSSNVDNVFEHRLIALLALVFPMTNVDNQPLILRWGVDLALTANEAPNVPHLARLFLYAVFSSSQRSDGEKGFAVLLGQTQDAGTVALILDALRVVLNEEKSRIKDLMGSEITMIAVKRWLVTCANAPDPDARESAARLLSTWPILTETIPGGEALVNRLKHDCRARIRNVWRGDRS